MTEPVPAMVQIDLGGRITDPEPLLAALELYPGLPFEVRIDFAQRRHARLRGYPLRAPSPSG